MSICSKFLLLKLYSNYFPNKYVTHICLFSKLTHNENLSDIAKMIDEENMIIRF